MRCTAVAREMSLSMARQRVSCQVRARDRTKTAKVKCIVNREAEVQDRPDRPAQQHGRERQRSMPCAVAINKSESPIHLTMSMLALQEEVKAGLGCRSLSRASSRVSSPVTTHPKSAPFLLSIAAIHARCNKTPTDVTAIISATVPLVGTKLSYCMQLQGWSWMRRESANNSRTKHALRR